MEAIDVGALSLLPPLIAIGLALLTKEVISSLLIGILSGTFIYAYNTGGGIAETIDITIRLSAEKIGANASIIIFLALLGALVAIVTMAGGSKAYGEWASKKITSKRGAALSTSALGALIFIDDYFNCLTVGTVMRPVTDKYKISRAKLAYIIDATAAPICIIAPVSSWAASVISQLDDVGLDGMEAFIQLIPFNFYAILTIVMVITLSLTNLDFGAMKKFEMEAPDNATKENLTNTGDELVGIDISSKGKVLDLVIPVMCLIIFCTISMLYVGGYFAGGMTIAEGFGNTDAGLALAIGSFVTLIATFILLIPRRVITFTQFMNGISVGIKTMVPAFIILTLAWTISGVCRDLLSTGPYVGGLVESSNMPPALLPAIIFVVASVLAFSTGTSWGTFGILIPIVADALSSVAPELLIVSLSATLAGAVLGDHMSPISDTTILSSTGAGCHHIDHVRTQIPYVMLVGAACLVGYLVAGLTTSWVISFLVAIAVLVAALTGLHKMNEKKAIDVASKVA